MSNEYLVGECIGALKASLSSITDEYISNITIEQIAINAILVSFSFAMLIAKIKPSMITKIASQQSLQQIIKTELDELAEREREGQC